MMNKIYIPTLGRHNQQITFDNLPKFLQDKTVLVVQPHEKHLYNNYPILILPEDWLGISKTRKWIIENAGKSFFGMFDDDFKLVKRHTTSPTKRPLTEDDWIEFHDKTYDWLKNDVSFVGIRRGNLPPSNDIIYNSETIVATFYNGHKLPDPNDLVWNHDLLSEDINFHLQLLLKGHKNKVWGKYGYIGKWAQDGGCQVGPNKRTIDLMNRSHDRLIELYPDFVKWKIKHGEQQYGGGNYKGLIGFKMIKVFYSKAAKYSDTHGRGKLFD